MDIIIRLFTGIISLALGIGIIALPIFMIYVLFRNNSAAIQELKRRIKTNNEAKTKHINEEQQQKEGNNQANYKSSYQAKLLLTRNEWYEYRKLKKLAESMGLQVCPKVRLLDIIEPRRGENYKSLLGKIQSKHVDFLITDPDLRIKAILELDDNSHNAPDRKERDAFVDEILTSVGYKVIRTRSITDSTLDILKPEAAPSQSESTTQ